MINNRQQAGRRRGRGGNGNGGGGGPRQGGQGRADNGNRIDNRSRGNANQLYEKYKTLAADAQRQGDRVNTEYYLQFADHYFRVLSDQRGRTEDQPRRQQPDFDIDGADEDYGDEGEPIRAGEQQGGDYGQQQTRREPRGDRQRDDRVQDARGQEGRPPEGRQRDARQQDGRLPEGRSFEGRQRDDRGEDGRGQEARQQDERQQAGERAERPRRWERDDRPRRQETEVEVGGQHRADPVAAGEDLAGRAEAVIEADAPLGETPPRRRGRPRREPLAAPDVGGDDGGQGLVAEGGVDADRLPPSLGTSLGTPANDADDELPKPRRRRVRAATAGDTSAE